METGNIFFKAFLGLVVLCAWTITTNNEIAKAEWLLGTCENKTQRGAIYETWTKTNDNEFHGKTYMVKEQDTIVFENIRLVQEPEGLVYIPRVKNQNAGLPIRFTIKSISEKQMVFENQQHDFPQIISYTQISSDSLVAEISGTKNGQERRQVFPMKKLK